MFSVFAKSAAHVAGLILVGGTTVVIAEEFSPVVRTGIRKVLGWVGAPTVSNFNSKFTKSTSNAVRADKPVDAEFRSAA